MSSRTGYTSSLQVDGITGATAKLSLVDPYTQGVGHVLFNPNKLAIELQAAIGTLNPVGSGHPVQNWSHTEAAKFDLEIYWSAIWAKQLGKGGKLNQVSGWLNSFLCPYAQHQAASPLIIVWPNTLTMLVVIGSCKTQYDRWFADGTPRTVTIVMSCIELRQRLRTSAIMRKNGFAKSDEGHGLSGLASGFNVGQRGRGPNLGNS